MSLNENSSREDILEYLSEKPYLFVFKFSNESWAQPYLGEAAKEIVNKHPFFLLYDFSDKPWAQPYIDEAAKEAASRNPEYFLEHCADTFPQGVDTALFNLTS